VTTVTVLPLLLSIVAPPKRPLSSLGIQSTVDAWLAALWHAINARRRVVLAVGLVLVVLGAPAARGIAINNQNVDSVPVGPERSAIRLLENTLSGVTRFVVFFEGPPGAMLDLEVLRAIAAVDAFAESEPLVDTSLSLPDLLAETNAAFMGEADAHRLPDSATLVAQYMTLIDPEDRADFVDESYARSHIHILETDRGSWEAARLRENLRKKIDEQRFQRFGVRASLTGNGVVTYAALDEMVEEMLWGFALSFAIAILVELAIFRSLRIAAVSILPNLLPVLACFTTMRVFGVEFRIDTSLVLSVSIGALFNTTIHIVARIRQCLQAGESDPDRIVEHALRAVGPASLYTAAMLSAGCSVFLLSRFPGLQVLGVLSVVTMLAGFLSDAVFTPILMRQFYDWRQRTPVSVARSAPNPSAEQVARGGE
jgi:predicted RND superfamily exporter protein